MKIGYIIYTYDRIHDACIQMEIVRWLWEKVFWKIHIIHSYNGDPSWNFQYLEDEIITMENPWHFEGAANLIDKWIERAKTMDLDYIVVSASDTWMMKLDFILSKLEEMRKDGKALLTCPWWYPGFNNPQDVWMATDFFIIDANWEKKNNIFPLRYASFRDKYQELLRYLWRWNVMVERLFFSRYLDACAKYVSENELKKYALSKLMIFEERMPVHADSSWNRKSEAEEIWLYMNHEIQEKIKAINPVIDELWEWSRKLIELQD